MEGGRKKDGGGKRSEEIRGNKSISEKPAHQLAGLVCCVAVSLAPARKPVVVPRSSPGDRYWPEFYSEYGRERSSSWSRIDFSRRRVSRVKNTSISFSRCRSNARTYICTYVRACDLAERAFNKLALIHETGRIDNDLRATMDGSREWISQPRCPEYYSNRRTMKSRRRTNDVVSLFPISNNDPNDTGVHAARQRGERERERESRWNGKKTVAHDATAQEDHRILPGRRAHKKTRFHAQ